ncbi:MAG: hypothetical protein LBP58_02540 [Azoarcus sp.]|jgi:hypothetical protein|nr:hypothetical protein [Azoarcus sp.]
MSFALDDSMDQHRTFLPSVVGMIDRLIVLLVFALLIFTLGGTSFVSRKAPPPRQSVPVDLSESVGNSPILPLLVVSDGENPAADDLPGVKRQQAGDDKPRNDCGAFPGRPADNSPRNELCAYLSRAIKYSDACAKRHQKRNAGRHSGKYVKTVSLWYSRARNLKVEHGLKCEPSRNITGFRHILENDSLIFQQVGPSQEADWRDF